MADIVFQAIASDLLHNLLRFAQGSQQPYLLHRILLANLRHCKSDMDQNPIAKLRHVVFKKAELNFAPNSGYLHDTHLILASGDLDNFSWYG
jgi:hypothetical protein